MSQKPSPANKSNNNFAECSKKSKTNKSEDTPAAKEKVQKCNQNEVNPLEEKRLKIDPSIYMERLSKAKESFKKLKEVSLLGFVVGEPIEFTKLRAKLRKEWGLFGSNVDFFNKQQYWFEIRFKNMSDRNRVWEKRPYHIFGQLLVLKEWKPHFNPTNESKANVDLWFRLPKLSPMFLSREALPTIL